MWLEDYNGLSLPPVPQQREPDLKMVYRLLGIVACTYLDEPTLKVGLNPLLTVFGNQNRLESFNRQVQNLSRFPKQNVVTVFLLHVLHVQRQAAVFHFSKHF